MIQIKNEKQSVTILPSCGGAIAQWSYCGVPVFFPRQRVAKQNGPAMQDSALFFWPCPRPMNRNYQNFQLFGALRDRAADEVRGDTAIFRGLDLLGPLYRVKAEVRVALVLHETGFAYRLSARLTGRSAASVKTLPINPGVQLCFSTPRGRAEVGIFGDSRVHRFSGKVAGVESAAARTGAILTIPSVGKVRISFEGALETMPGRRMLFWRESDRFLRIESLLGNPSIYGTLQGGRVGHEWFTMGCALEVLSLSK